MTKDFDYRILVKVSSNASLTITTVLSAPRKCMPGEVLSACRNIELASEPELVPRSWLDFVAFVVKDFFALAHRTGLYNRQTALWTAIGRVVEVKVVRPQTGIFTSVDEPYADFSFFDGRGNRIIWATLLDLQPKDARLLKDKGLKRFIADSIRRAEKIQKKEGKLSGLFIGLPGPITEPVFDVVARLTGASDPVGRYEALLPAPMKIPLNLLATTPLVSDESSIQITLSSPRLRTKSSDAAIGA
jgi:hypothetical protein